MPMNFDRDAANEFYKILSLYEEPMGAFYTDKKPIECISPKEAHLVTCEEEKSGKVNFGEVFSSFSCAFQSIWRARKKHTAACFDNSHFGCMGGAFAFGFNKPQVEFIVRYVSTGIPGVMEGERYIDSPDQLRKFFDYIDPRPAPKQYLVFKHLSLFEPDEEPEVVLFFERPEIVGGLHQLTYFITNDLESVRSPWGAGCYNAVTWPIKYLAQGEMKAVLGSWDPSCRKFFRTDEIIFSMPFKLFQLMVSRWKESFLNSKHNSSWEVVRKRAMRSRAKWGEDEPKW